VRIISRTDASLAISLVIATLTLFSQPLKQLMDTIAAIENEYHLAFLPALAVLSVAFAITQSRKRVETAAEARLSRARGDELQRVLTFGNALAGSLDEEALQRTLCQQLPAFFGDRGYWLLARRDSSWVEIAQAAPHGHQRSIEAQEQFAEQALLEVAGPDVGRQGVEIEDVVCFPLILGATVVGVLGVHNAPTLSETDRMASTTALVPLSLALRNLRVLQDLQQQGIVDQLTGCLNRSTGLMTLQGELRRARRSRQPISIMMIDIDHFKTINDTRGHLAGDAVLEALGALIGQVLRTTDVRCRFGGDEFLVILPETSLEGAEQAAKKILAAMRALAAKADRSTAGTTLSIGIAQARRGELDATQVIGRADAALYRSKQAGRDTLRLAPADASNGAPAEHVPAILGRDLAAAEHSPTTDTPSPVLASR
jgi:diguanylate cyclase (GGDEF)-like protein